jgi:hypothetical protein
MGVARMPTQGSWRPKVSTAWAGRHGRSIARHADRAGGLDGDVHHQVLPGGDAAEHAAGMVAAKAMRAELVAMFAARCMTTPKPAPISTPLTALMPIIA